MSRLSASDLFMLGLDHGKQTLPSLSWEFLLDNDSVERGGLSDVPEKHKKQKNMYNHLRVVLFDYDQVLK